MNGFYYLSLQISKLDQTGLKPQWIGLSSDMEWHAKRQDLSLTIKLVDFRFYFPIFSSFKGLVPFEFIIISSHITETEKGY